MKRIIVANPASGKTTPEEKKELLQTPAKILGCEILGLDTTSPAEFRETVRDASHRYECVVIAGGDGTVNDALNSFGNGAYFAYLRLGSGNALSGNFDNSGPLQYAFSPQRALIAEAQRIKRGTPRSVDVLVFNESQRGFISSIGLDADAARRNETFRKDGKPGLVAYTAATIGALYHHRPTTATITLDGKVEETSLLSLQITKHPFFGYNILINPNAKIDDGFLHTLTINGNVLTVASALLEGILTENHQGIYRPARHVEVRTSRPLHLQIDGNYAATASEFSFDVEEKAIRMIY